MSSEPTAPAPGPTTPNTPLASQTSGSKTRQAFLFQHNHLVDEPVFESSETLLDQEKVDSSQSSPFQSSSNSPGSKQRLTRVHFHFHGNYPSPDNSPQDVDKSCHLSDSTSITDSLDESGKLSVQDDHLHQLDSTRFSSQDTSSVEIEFVSEFEEQVDHGNLQMFS